MNQVKKYTATSSEVDAAGAAFSFSIESPSASTPPPLQRVVYEDLNSPEQPDARQFIVPGFLIVNFALIQLGFMLGYLDVQNSSLVVGVHVAGFIAALGAIWNVKDRLAPGIRECIRSLSLNSEALATLGLVALAISAAWILFDPTQRVETWTSAESFLFSSSIIALFFSLKDAGVRWFYARCTFLPDERVLQVRVIDTSDGISERNIAVTELKAGDVVRIRAGETAVADCILLSGLCEVSERKLSGQSFIRVKGEGDTLYAGSTVTQGTVDCKVQATPDESYITSFIGSVRRNLDSVVKTLQGRSDVERNSYIAALFAGTVAAVFWYGSGKGVPFSLSVFGSALLVAVVPFTLLMHAYVMRRALLMCFAHGVLFKEYLPSFESLAETDVFALDYNSKAPIGQLRVEKFELIDERVDRQALLSVLISIFGRSDEDFHTSATQFLRSNLESLNLYSITNLDVFEDPGMPIHGIGALIEGIEFTIGSEELLIARGVQLQASEVDLNDDSQVYVYVAMQDEAVARFALVPRFVHDGRELVSDLKAKRIRTVLCSEEPSELVQPVAETITIDIPDTFPGLFGDRFVEKVDSLRPVAFLSNKLTPPAITQKANVSFGIFDEYRWDIESVDVTLFNNDLPRIASVIGLAKTVRATLKENNIFALIITGFLLLFAASGFSDPAVIALSSLVASLYVYFHSASSVERI